MLKKIISSKVAASTLEWSKSNKENAPICNEKNAQTFFCTDLSYLLIPLSTVCHVTLQHTSRSGKNYGKEYGETEQPKTLI
jgi:hypothetical protein